MRTSVKTRELNAIKRGSATYGPESPYQRLVLYTCAHDVFGLLLQFPKSTGQPVGCSRGNKHKQAKTLIPVRVWASCEGEADDDFLNVNGDQNQQPRAQEVEHYFSSQRDPCGGKRVIPQVAGAEESCPSPCRL
ncbi:hypothetical protein Y1Q_0023349 [Alligator mississippiensis]|uniref:Uncharacterized protein n=1 Tax=Alligator mississippiensis TaxID=8496 RepID=A0A151NP68_ALLMI|nr:hypothetical protein Y1Q_0023349 [Alligator mississippiensis]